MMHLSANKSIDDHQRLKIALVSAFVMMQAILAGYLLTHDLLSSLAVSSLFGLVVALICCGVLLRVPGWRYSEMVMAMISAGGLGMILGHWLNMGVANEHALLHQHYAMAEQPEMGLMMLESPWVYLGMFVGGNLGMWFFDGLRRRSLKLLGGDLIIYTVCNIGMFVGMVLAGNIAWQLSAGLSQLTASIIMMAAMLAGMTLGMIVLLATTITLMDWFADARHKK